MSEGPRLYLAPLSRLRLRAEYAKKIAIIRRQQYARVVSLWKIGDADITALEEAEMAALKAECHLQLCLMDLEEEERDAA